MGGLCFDCTWVMSQVRHVSVHPEVGYPHFFGSILDGVRWEPVWWGVVDRLEEVVSQP